MTDEQLVLAWLRNRGVDVAMAEHHIAGKKSAGPFCLASCRALAVVAAMENPWNAGGFSLEESLEYGIAVILRKSNTPTLPVDRRWVCRTFTVDDMGNRKIVMERHAATPWDALVALAKEAK